MAPNETWSIDLPVGTPFAVLPMVDTIVTTRGLEWDMDEMRLSPVGRVSSSNRTELNHVSLQIKGVAIVTLPLSQLAAALNVVRV
ncbi:MAG: thiamine pyrophosphokinase [Yoonia sp.]